MDTTNRRCSLWLQAATPRCSSQHTSAFSHIIRSQCRQSESGIYRVGATRFYPLHLVAIYDFWLAALSSRASWEELHNNFNLSKTKSRKLRSDMQSITKGNRSIAEFLLQVHTIAESLRSIGDPILHRDQLEIMLEALLEEYDSVVAAVNSKSELCSINELESLLLVHEEHIEKSFCLATTILEFCSVGFQFQWFWSTTVFWISRQSWSTILRQRRKIWPFAWSWRQVPLAIQITEAFICLTSAPNPPRPPYTSKLWPSSSCSSLS